MRNMRLTQLSELDEFQFLANKNVALHKKYMKKVHDKNNEARILTM